ncbi:MAG: HAD family hydrolase [Candidatus Bathyarchaeota archaeon]|nr:MAG: HAD family hydrolase [Candidatus Bathyarchaeota archaeon]
MNRFDSDFDEKIFQRILNLVGIARSLKNIKKAFKNAIEDAEDLELLSYYGKIDSNEYWHQFNSLVIKHLKIAENEDLAKVIHSKWFDFMECTPYPEAKDVLSELKQRGLKIGVISTAYEEEIRFVLEKAGLEKTTFDTIVGVDTAQCMKPHPDIFKCALRKLNVRPEDAMFVGDEIEADYKGAKSVGMQALLIDRTEKQKEDDLKTIKNLKEILSNID